LKSIFRMPETVQNIIVKQLVNDKIITKEQGEAFLDKYQITILKKSWFKRLWDKMKQYPNSKEDDYYYQIISCEIDKD